MTIENLPVPHGLAITLVRRVSSGTGSPRAAGARLPFNQDVLGPPAFDQVVDGGTGRSSSAHDASHAASVPGSNVVQVTIALSENDRENAMENALRQRLEVRRVVREMCGDSLLYIGLMQIMDAVEMAELVRAGSMSPSEIVSEAIGRAEATNPIVNAIVESDYDGARARAEDVSRDGLLAGVPILLKDSGAPLEGDRGYRGNRVLREMDFRYPYTGNVARRLLGAGAVSLGRSHSPELGSGNCPAAAETNLYGPTRNPWDLGRTPLGSSGGAAAAVAIGIVPIAHASDGGGSIRLPASACGVVGLKPSRGRISIAPEGESWAGGATDGVVSRTVRDTALGLDVLAGYEPGDPHQASLHDGKWLAEVGVDPGRLRIGLCDSLPYAATDPQCRLAVKEAGALLASLGHHVGVDHPAGMDSMDYMYDYVRVIRASAAAGLDALAAVFGRPLTPDDVEDGTWIAGQRGRKISAPDYVASLERIHSFSRSIVAWWQRADLLVTPSVARTPPPLGYLVEGDQKQRTTRLAEITPYVTMFNVTGQPAISLPLHWTPEGLPIGVQIVAAPGREDVLLRVASQLEAVAPWIDREPPLVQPDQHGQSQSSPLSR